MSDRLEELRHALADLEVASAAEQDDADGDANRAQLDVEIERIEAEILQLEHAAREKAGAVVPEADVEGSAEEVAESRPPAAELVVPSLPPGGELREATVMVLDRHDEDRILNALEERMDKVLLYDFPQDGSRLVDLSINGVLECVRQINQTQHARVRILPGSLEVEQVQMGEEGVFWVATVAAEDMLTGLVMYGTSSEPMMAYRKKGPDKFDKFARAKAISKAQRNALKQHIPERLRQAVIAMHKGDQQRVLEVKHGAGAAAAAALPPPVDTPRAKELEEEVRALYLDVRALPGWQPLMPPGVFNAKLSRARSSEAELESFRDAVSSLLEKLKADAA